MLNGKSAVSALFLLAQNATVSDHSEDTDCYTQPYEQDDWDGTVNEIRAKLKSIQDLNDVEIPELEERERAAALDLLSLRAVEFDAGLNHFSQALASLKGDFDNLRVNLSSWEMGARLALLRADFVNQATHYIQPDFIDHEFAICLANSIVEVNSDALIAVGGNRAQIEADKGVLTSYFKSRDFKLAHAYEFLKGFYGTDEAYTNYLNEYDPFFPRTVTPLTSLLGLNYSESDYCDQLMNVLYGHLSQRLGHLRDVYNNEIREFRSRLDWRKYHRARDDEYRELKGPPLHTGVKKEGKRYDLQKKVSGLSNLRSGVMAVSDLNSLKQDLQASFESGIEAAITIAVTAKQKKWVEKNIDREVVVWRDHPSGPDGMGGGRFRSREANPAYVDAMAAINAQRRSAEKEFEIAKSFDRRELLGRGEFEFPKHIATVVDDEFQEFLTIYRVDRIIPEVGGGPIYFGIAGSLELLGPVIKAAVEYVPDFLERFSIDPAGLTDKGYVRLWDALLSFGGDRNNNDTIQESENWEVYSEFLDQVKNEVATINDESERACKRAVNELEKRSNTKNFSVGVFWSSSGGFPISVITQVGDLKIAINTNLKSVQFRPEFVNGPLIIPSIVLQALHAGHQDGNYAIRAFSDGNGLIDTLGSNLEDTQIQGERDVRTSATSNGLDSSRDKSVRFLNTNEQSRALSGATDKIGRPSKPVPLSISSDGAIALSTDYYLEGSWRSDQPIGLSLGVGNNWFTTFDSAIASSQAIGFPIRPIFNASGGLGMDATSAMFERPFWPFMFGMPDSMGPRLGIYGSGTFSPATYSIASSMVDDLKTYGSTIWIGHSEGSVHTQNGLRMVDSALGEQVRQGTMSEEDYFDLKSRIFIVVAGAFADPNRWPTGINLIHVNNPTDLIPMLGGNVTVNLAETSLDAHLFNEAYIHQIVEAFNLRFGAIWPGIAELRLRELENSKH